MSFEEMMDFLFTAHPKSIGETYWQHWKTAFRIWLRLLFASLALLVHMWVPGLCQTTTSAQIKILNNRLQTRRTNVSSPIIMETNTNKETQEEEKTRDETIDEIQDSSHEGVTPTSSET